MLTQGNDNIIQFNIHVKTLMKTLSERGEVTHDLLTNLLKDTIVAEIMNSIDISSKNKMSMMIMGK